MVSTLDTKSPEQELVDIFQKAQGTIWDTKKITSNVKRWWYGLDSDEDLIEGHYTNGDLTMRYRQALTEATSQILNLSITDSKSGLSTDQEVTEKDDLIYRLSIMEIQRHKAWSRKNRWDGNNLISLI